MLFDPVVRYGTDCSNTAYWENEGEPVPNTPYAMFSLAYFLFPDMTYFYQENPYKKLTITAS